MGTKIDSVTAREKLPAKREPYWHRISKGCYVGFRKMSVDTVGNWQARYRKDSGVQVLQALGSLDQYPSNERFDKAVVRALDWFKHMGMGGTTNSGTVLDACLSYEAHIRHEKSDKAADDLKARYRRWVAPDPIHRVELMKLTRDHVKAYRRRLMAAPVKVNKAGDTRERSKDSVNRDMAAVRAALNHALADGKVTTDFAWREALKAIKDAGRRRELYLDRDQRRALIRNAPADLAAFLRGLSMMPLRPGALASLSTGDFDARLNVLRIGKDKHGKDRKIKLPAQTAEVINKEAKDKQPSAALFSRADGTAWNKDSWKWPVKAAVTAAGLPAETTAYTLRHSVISDLVHGGLDLLTVAQISGTSVAMIEKHYGHLRSDVASSALAKLAL